MSEEEIKNYAQSKSRSRRSDSKDQYDSLGNEEASLRTRVSRAFGVMCLVLLLFWVLSIWRWPFSFLGDYIEFFFVTFVALGYVGTVLNAKTVRSVFGKVAETSIEFMVAIWFFLPLGWLAEPPWVTYLSVISTVLIVTLTASIFFGGSISDKYSRLSERIGGYLHGIGLMVVVFWFFGTIGLFSFIGIAPRVFSDYLVPLGFGIYILGSVIQSASFPIRWVAAERASYSISWGCLGALMMTLVFRWIDVLPTSSLFDLERIFFLLFVSWLIVGVALSASKSAETKLKENEIRKTWWWERYSKPIRESARVLTEELKKLKLTNLVYVLPLGGQIVKTERVTVSSKVETLAIPVMLGEDEVGAVFIGSGAYSVNANVKEFADRFDGDTTVFTSPKVWQSMKAEQKWLQAYPENIKQAGFQEAEDVIRIAENKLNEFKSFAERAQLSGSRGTGKVSHVNLPGVSVEEGPGYERVRLPFIDVISDNEGDFVRVGPLRVWDRGSTSVVKFGPFLAVDETIPDAITKPSKVLVAISDRSGKDVDIATLKEEILFHKGTTNLHMKGSLMSLRDNGTTVRITRNRKEIRTPRLLLLVKPKIKALLKSGALKFKANVDGSVFLRSRTGEVMRAKDTALAIRLIEQLDEMVDDLTRAALEKRELEELAEFFSQMDNTFRDEEKKS
jgi:hypothetical protein